MDCAPGVPGARQKWCIICFWNWTLSDHRTDIALRPSSSTMRLIFQNDLGHKEIELVWN